MKKISGKNLARPEISDVIPYIPGKSIEEVKRVYNIKEVIKLASNENPLGPSPKAIEAMKRALESSHLYPESDSFTLRKKVASFFGINEDELIFSTGAESIILMIALAFLCKDEEAIMGDPSFGDYEIVTKIMGGKVVKVPLRDFTYDLPAIADRITSRTKLIFICNPNNPTGTIVTEEQTDRFMEIVPPHCIVVFDEAYAEFVKNKDYPKTVKYIHNQKKVIIVRTFSKIFGLAGARIGYAMGPKDLIEILRKVVLPFPVNRVAQAGALAALEDKEFTDKVMEVIEQGKQYLYNQFHRLGLEYIPTNTNFIFVNLNMNGDEVCERLLEKGIIIRPGSMWNLPNYVRITIGKPKENEMLIKALEAILRDNSVS